MQVYSVNTNRFQTNFGVIESFKPKKPDINIMVKMANDRVDRFIRLAQEGAARKNTPNIPQPKVVKR